MLAVSADPASHYANEMNAICFIKSYHLTPLPRLSFNLHDRNVRSSCQQTFKILLQCALFVWLPGLDFGIDSWRLTSH